MEKFKHVYVHNVSFNHVKCGTSNTNLIELISTGAVEIEFTAASDNLQLKGEIKTQIKNTESFTPESYVRKVLGMN